MKKVCKIPAVCLPQPVAGELMTGDRNTFLAEADWFRVPAACAVYATGVRFGRRPPDVLRYKGFLGAAIVCPVGEKFKGQREFAVHFRRILLCPGSLRGARMLFAEVPPEIADLADHLAWEYGACG